MKNWYRLLLFFVIVTIMNITKGKAQTTFSEVFNSYSYRTIANAVVSTPDKHFVIAGEEGNKGYVLKIDTAGKSVWSKSVFGHVFKCIATTKDSCLILGGENGITKLNANGNILWSKVISSVDPINIICIQQTFDLGFILTGYTLGSTSSFSNLFIAKLDANGIIQWTKTLTIGTTLNKSVSIKQAADSSYFVIGNFASPNVSTQIFLLKLAVSGTILWEKTFTLDGILANDLEITNTGLVLYLHTTNQIILKTDFYGNIKWCKSYNFSTYDPQMRGSIYNKIHRTNDGGFIFTVVNCDLNRLIKADSLGNVVWGSDLTLLVAEAIPTKDKGYLMVGTGPGCDAVFRQDIVTGKEIGIIKTDSLGNSAQSNSCLKHTVYSVTNYLVNSSITPFTLANATVNSAAASPIINDLPMTLRIGCITPGGGTTADKNIKNIITISPSPFSTKATVLATMPFKNAVLTIYNIIGQQVKQVDNISGTSINLERDNLQAGLYLIRITSPLKGEMNTVVTGKMLITD